VDSYVATAYVEQLEDLGFIGPQKGTAARDHQVMG
jgi:hypothetical protein